LPIPILEPSARETALRIRRRVQAVEGVKGCEVALLSTGKKPHVRVTLALEGSPGPERAHAICAGVDHEVRKLVPNSRVSILSGTGGREDGQVWKLVERIAENEPGSRGAHNIYVRREGNEVGVDFHLEVAAPLGEKEARQVASQVERKLKAADPKISEVVVHRETAADRVSSEWWGHGIETRLYVEHLMRRFPDLRLASPPVIRRMSDGRLRVALRVAFDRDPGQEQAESAVSGLEAAVMSGDGSIAKVEVARVTGEPKTRRRKRTG